jgi:CheY-like chemotaxis protein
LADPFNPGVDPLQIEQQWEHGARFRWSTALCVLLIEDDDIIRMVLVDAMTDAGFEVIEAVDAETALALAEATPCPDLIVSDINLGAGMDGFALAAALRRRWPTVPMLR